MRIFLMIFAALIVAGGSGYYMLLGLRPATPSVVAAAAPAATQTEVFVPATELNVGTIIRPEQLGRIPMAESAITPEMVVADDEGQKLLVGSVARQVLPQGLPIARSATVQPGDRGFLAAVLHKGMRAVSIPVTEITGVSGLVMPGDRVDILLTYSVAGDLINAGREIHASETVVRNLRVLALDQRLESGQPLVDKAAQGATIEAPPVAKTVTLEVSPQQAEIITLAKTLGDLSLALNSVSDGGDDVAADARPDAEEQVSSQPFSDTLSRLRDAARMGAIMPRRMTLNSDVTSLLRRELSDPAAGELSPTAVTPAPAPSANAVPLPDRTLSIQVVRGSKNQSVEFGGDAGAAAGAPTTDAAPTVTAGAPQTLPADATPGATAPATSAAAPAAR